MFCAKIECSSHADPVLNH